MLKLTIRTRNGTYAAELDDSDIANAVWFSAKPFKTETNELGDSIYFEIPVDTPADGERQTVFDKGDIAWWPGVNALVIFYGPTPLSGEDGRPVWKYGCIKIGRITGECDSLSDAGDRQPITLEQDFRFIPR